MWRQQLLQCPSMDPGGRCLPRSLPSRTPSKGLTCTRRFCSAMTRVSTSAVLRGVRPASSGSGDWGVSEGSSTTRAEEKLCWRAVRRKHRMAAEGRQWLGPALGRGKVGRGGPNRPGHTGQQHSLLLREAEDLQYPGELHRQGLMDLVGDRGENSLAMSTPYLLAHGQDRGGC